MGTQVGGEFLHDGCGEAIEEVRLIDAAGLPEAVHFGIDFAAGGDRRYRFRADGSAIDARLPMTFIPFNGLFCAVADIAIEERSPWIAQQASVLALVNHGRASDPLAAFGGTPPLQGTYIVD